LLVSTDGGRQWRRQAMPELERAGPLSSNGHGALAWVGRTPVGLMKPPEFSLHGSDDAGASWRLARMPLDNAELFPRRP
jgi:hypothetical protein